MKDKKFYGCIVFIFGVIGIICSIITCIFIWMNRTYKIKFGNDPYIYFTIIAFICFICNLFLQKKYEKTLLSKIGKLLSILSLLPVFLFIVIYVLVLLITPFVLNHFPMSLQ